MNYRISILPGDISKNTPHKFDENGVIMSKIPYTQNYFYHTTAIASQGIRNPQYPEGVNDWLVDNITKEGTYIHDFVLPFYNFKKPWVGGLSQGLAISSLIKAYDITDDTLYLDTAKKAFEGLRKHCVVKDSEDNYWITEYPGVPTILNGFIYALFGVYDIKDYVAEAEELWKECIHTLRKNLLKYDLNYWSRYDMETGIPATIFYHKIHIEQMKALSDLSEEHCEPFRLYNRKWQWQLDHVFCRFRAKMRRNRMIVKKHGVIGTYNRYVERRKWLK